MRAQPRKYFQVGWYFVYGATRVIGHIAAGVFRRTNDGHGI